MAVEAKVDLTDARFVAAVRELMEQALTLSADYGDEVREIVRLAAAEPLEEARARRLFTRILSVLRGVDRGGLDAAARTRLVEQVRQEVDEVVAAIPRPAARVRLNFVKRYGHEPHQVVPVPVFNGMPVPMFEGYVDVNDLELWPDNHRVELY